MMPTGKRGRPRTWVLDEEIAEIYRLAVKLKAENPKAHWSYIKQQLRTELELTERQDLLSKLEKLWGLLKQAIPVPPRCICGSRVYSYYYTADHGEIFARCTNPHCRYLRRYLPNTSYKWSRLESIIKEFEMMPTFYELDGQRVEDHER